MTRKLLAIFCVFLMLLFHYGRMVNFWGCEFIHFTIGTATCDCEKQSRDANSDAQQSSSQKNAKDKTEDLFSSNRNLYTFFVGTKKISSSKIFSISDLSSGFNAKIFQPPRS
ncbi:MAG TPA: hypothetical protein VKR53_10310 [Puia sp.]|nr:hypothetical protein [Puia sp.]